MAAASTLGTHHMSRRQARTHDGQHDVGQQLERPARAARRRGLEGGGDQQRALKSYQGEFQIAFHETPLGAKTVEPPAPTRARPRRHPVIGGKENLRALDFAHRMSAALQERRQLFTLVLAQFDTPAYVHQDFLLEPCDILLQKARCSIRLSYGRSARPLIRSLTPALPVIKSTQVITSGGATSRSRLPLKEFGLEPATFCLEGRCLVGRWRKLSA